MITKEELHKLIDEADIDRLNRLRLEYWTEYCSDYQEIYIEEIAEFLAECNPKYMGVTLDRFRKTAKYMLMLC